MARLKKEAMNDFNKLVLGKAENLLFIGPRVSDGELEDYLQVLAAPAKHCKGNLYLAMIPHPDEWDDQVEWGIKMWKWESSSWAPIS